MVGYGYRIFTGKACERYIFHVMAYANFFEMPKIRTLSDSLCFYVRIVITCSFFEMPDFHMFDYFEMPNFRIRMNRKSGISKKEHVMRIRTKNREKLKVFEFWAFQKKLHMPSREKYIFHMLFRAFHDTPRI